MSTPLNRVSHFEIHVSDLEKGVAFYSEVFGWKISKWDNPAMEYWMVETGSREEAGGINGGLVKRMGPAPTEGQAVNAYVCTMVVGSLEEMLEKVMKAGGSLALPKMAIPGMGWLAYCKDFEGNIFGMMQDDTTAK